MKKHNAIKVVLVTILLCMLLTWIIPSAVFNSEFADQGRVQMGLFDLFNYPLTSLSYFGNISLFIIVVGGFYGILYKIPAYRNLLDAIAKKGSKRGMLTISIIMILLAVITSICGLQIGLMLFFPFIVSLILLMGYDKIVAALTVVGSTMVGVVGTTYGYGNVSILTQYLSLDLADNILVKVIILVVGLVLLIFNTALYVKKNNTIKKVTKKESKNDEVATLIEKEVEVVEKPVEKKSTKTNTKSKKSSSKTTSKTTSKKTTKSKNNNKAAVKDSDVIIVKESLNEDDNLVPTATNSLLKSWPVMVALVILFVILVLAFIPWNTAFGLNIMTDAKEAVYGFKLFGFELFAKLLGNINAFGEWMINDIVLVMAILVLLLSLIYKLKFQDVLDGFVAGAKKALAPAVVTLFIYTVLVITTYHPFQLTIYKWILTITKEFNIFTSSVVAMLAGLFNADPTYAFQSVVPYLTSVVTNAKVYPIVEIVFQSMYGFVMLLAPTSVVLMSTLSYLGVSYKEWLKSIWKLLVELLVILLIIFTILVLI